MIPNEDKFISKYEIVCSKCYEVGKSRRKVIINGNPITYYLCKICLAGWKERRDMWIRYDFLDFLSLHYGAPQALPGAQPEKDPHEERKGNDNVSLIPLSRK